MLFLSTIKSGISTNGYAVFHCPFFLLFCRRILEYAKREKSNDNPLNYCREQAPHQYQHARKTDVGNQELHENANFLVTDYNYCHNHDNNRKKNFRRCKLKELHHELPCNPHWAVHPYSLLIIQSTVILYFVFSFMST